jgi:hypothetical protein
LRRGLNIKKGGISPPLPYIDVIREKKDVVKEIIGLF